MDNLKVKISNGNTKMGRIKSVSLPPVVTCRKDAPCIKKCYARRLMRYPNVRNAYDNNLSLYKQDSGEYFAQVEHIARLERFFRWHVAGDIPDVEYLANMCYIAIKCEDTQFLCFTKQHEIVNKYIGMGFRIPHNLSLIFSEWEGLELNNPHNLPTAKVITQEQADAMQDKRFLCGGNCEHCVINKVGCWYLLDGESIYLVEH